MGETRKNVTIMSTSKGIVALDSPAKIKILELLRDETKSFEEIVNSTGKAKSTISVHLDDLEKQGLIIEHRDDKDMRKKYYSLNAQYIASSQQPLDNHYQQVLQNLSERAGDEYTFLKYMFHALRYGLEAYGMNQQPIMKQIGRDIGSMISKNFQSEELEGLLEEIKAYWARNHLGTMRIENRDPVVLIVEECFDCGDMPDVGKPLCSLDEGMLEEILTAKLGGAYTVRETECFGTGHTHCKFIIEAVQ
jgi:hypothetical protein